MSSGLKEELAQVTQELQETLRYVWFLVLRVLLTTATFDIVFIIFAPLQPNRIFGYFNVILFLE